MIRNEVGNQVGPRQLELPSLDLALGLGRIVANLVPTADKGMVLVKLGEAADAVIGKKLPRLLHCGFDLAAPGRY
jgi:hypothetical protein